MKDSLVSITIITVVYNSVVTLEQTILSVINQTYKNIEYIIIDGGSTDGTVDIIKKYEDKLAYWVSEPDNGIYDAMNKGIEKANGEWLNFMNSGDIFYSKDILNTVFSSYFTSSIKFLYSDFFVILRGTKVLKVAADFENGIILHQSILYKKELHDKYGYYIVTKKIMPSDYIFCNSIPSEFIAKINTPISINETAGISSNSWWFLQKICADYIFGRLSFNQMFKLAFKHKLKLFLKFIIGKTVLHKIKKFRYRNLTNIYK
jgi:glycosyltransferase involved in cell wall biosynthesis